MLATFGFFALGFTIAFIGTSLLGLGGDSKARIGIRIAVSVAAGLVGAFLKFVIIWYR